MSSMGYYRPTLPISRELAEVLAPRILARINQTPDGCWLRTVAINPFTGYTQISKTVAGKVTYYYAHRVMYVYVNGPIPEGLTIDHTCERPACCNPAHLRAVTHRANVLRSKTNPSAINSRKKTCMRGHRLPDRVEGTTRPPCLVCRRITDRARRAAKRGAA